MNADDKSVDELLLDLKDELSEENSSDENVSDLKTELAKYKCDLEQAYTRLDKAENQLKKSNKYNEELRSQVEKLSAELHNYRHTAKNHKEVSVQVDKDDLLKFSAGEISLPDWTRDGTGQINAKTDAAKDKDTGSGSMSIAETLKATAEAAMKQTGFVYDENTGLYYDHNSGYYYDSEKSLYYDPRTGTYFYYNSESGHYEFHSQVDLSYYTDSSRHHGGQSDQHHPYHDHDKCQDHPMPGTSREERHYKRRKDKEQLKNSDRSHPDVVKKEELNEVISFLGSLRISTAGGCALEIAAANWPPCIRMIAPSSGYLDVGTLFIVTCTGATIGREKDMNHTIMIPDLSVSKTHAEIKYDQQRKEYLIVDLGSQNGTYLNCKRLSEAKAVSEPVAINHGDQIQFGNDTKLLCHIHPGTDTCDDCEPGQVKAQWQAKNEPKKELVFLSKEEKQKQHKEQLRQIKQKYGLKNIRYVDNMAAIKNPGYTDKADERRQTVGSDNPHQKEPEEVPASVHRPISSGNIGHKLLKKMGWNEGESLGKTNTGIQEPVTVTIRSNQLAGLGSSGNLLLSPENPESENNKKAVRRVLAQKRFDQISRKLAGDGDTTSQIVWHGGGIITAEQPQDTSS